MTIRPVSRFSIIFVRNETEGKINIRIMAKPIEITDSNYNEVLRIPFSVEIYGRYLDFILLKRNDTIYFVDHSLFYSELDSLKNRYPEIFLNKMLSKYFTVIWIAPHNTKIILAVVITVIIILFIVYLFSINCSGITQ